MKLKFKDYEASGSPKEMAEFLWLTMPKVECQLPEDFSDRVIEDFKRRWDEAMNKQASEYKGGLLASVPPISPINN